MPWQERSIMRQRQEFVGFAAQEGATISVLCERYGVSRQTGYQWLARAAAGDRTLADHSRRPRSSPVQTSPDLEARVLALRAEHPSWGGRTLHHRLVHNGGADVPAPSTMTAILRRHGLLSPAPSPRDFLRFAHPVPNELGQRDFMGHPPLTTDRVHPWTVLDEHSRCAVGVAACANAQQPTVTAHLTAVFRRSGLPRIILTDKGAPWASAGMGGRTPLEAWLPRLGVDPWHGQIRHPQTQGQVERFPGTIATDGFAQRHLADLTDAQAHCEVFPACDHLERPPEALAYAVPASRSQPSPRSVPEIVPPVTYGPDDTVSTVTVHGSISWRGRRHFISRGLVGEPVAIRPTRETDIWEIVSCHRQVATIDLNDPDAV